MEAELQKFQQYYNRQPKDACDKSSSSDEEEFESDCCLIMRHFSKLEQIPLFKKNLNFGEFNEWVREVESFFELYDIREDEKVQLVALRLEQEVFLWWEIIQNLSRRFNRQPIQDWTEMKKGLMVRFLCLDDIFKENRQSPLQLDEEEECEWGCYCLVNRHLSKVDEIPVFKKNPNYEEYMEWVEEVERFFKLYEIPKDEQVELVTYRLGEEALSWWELMQNLYDKQLIQDWKLMKTVLMRRFLSP